MTAHVCVAFMTALGRVYHIRENTKQAVLHLALAIALGLAFVFWRVSPSFPHSRPTKKEYRRETWLGRRENQRKKRPQKKKDKK